MSPFLSAYGHGNRAEGTQNYGIIFFFFLLLEYELGKIQKSNKNIKFYRTSTIIGLFLIIFNIFLLAHQFITYAILQHQAAFFYPFSQMLFFYAHQLKDKMKSHLFSPPSSMLSLKTKTNPYLHEQFKCLYYNINLFLSVETIQTSDL